MDNSCPPAWVLEKRSGGETLSHLEWSCKLKIKLAVSAPALCLLVRVVKLECMFDVLYISLAGSRSCIGDAAPMGMGWKGTRYRYEEGANIYILVWGHRSDVVMKNNHDVPMNACMQGACNHFAQRSRHASLAGCAEVRLHGGANGNQSQYKLFYRYTDEQ